MTIKFNPVRVVDIRLKDGSTVRICNNMKNYASYLRFSDSKNIEAAG